VQPRRSTGKGSRRGPGHRSLPRFYVVDAIERGELVTVLDAYCDVDGGVHAVYPSGARQLPPKTRACVDWLARELPARLAAPPRSR
jgi:DNA-binding transcriptional LysR family regulator